MTIIKRNLNSPFFPDWMEDFFSTSVNPISKSGFASVPMVNIFETDKSFKIELAIPGMNKDDVDINLENDVLNISSEKEENLEETAKKCTKREYFYSSFKRSFTLPKSVDKDKISAKSENGVLLIKIDKKEEEIEKSPRKIEIL